MAHDHLESSDAENPSSRNQQPKVNESPLGSGVNPPPEAIGDRLPLEECSDETLIDLWSSKYDQAAFTELWRRYVERLLEQAGKSRSVNPLDDSANVSAFLTVLRQATHRRFNHDRDDWFWRLIATVASRKRISRYHKRKPLTGDVLDHLEIPLRMFPGAEDIASYNEMRAKLWEILTPTEREFFEYRELGLKKSEIAREMHRNPKTIYRISLAVQQKFTKLFGNEKDNFGGE